MEEWKEYRLGEVVNILDYKRIPLSSAEENTEKGDFLIMVHKVLLIILMIISSMEHIYL